MSNAASVSGRAGGKRNQNAVIEQLNGIGQASSQALRDPAEVIGA